MNRSFWTRVLAVLLVVCMLPVGTVATGKNAPMSSHRADRITDLAPGRVSRLEPPKTTEPVATEPSEPDSGKEGTAHTLTAIENTSTVDNGSLLRASTYQAKAADEGAEQAEGITVKYFPVTMYNYDQTTINNATHAKEYAKNPNLTEWQGIYFNGGKPDAVTYTAGRNNWVDGGQYLIQNARAAGNMTNGQTYLKGTTGGVVGTTKDDASLWTLTFAGTDTYHLSTEIDGKTYYLHINGTGANQDVLQEDSADLQIAVYNGSSDWNVNNDGNLVTIKDKESTGKTLVQHGGVGVTTYGGENNQDDTGCAMWFYLVENGEEKKVTSGTSINAGFADWNFWNKNAAHNGGGNHIYTGLARSELVDGQIVFNYPDGGIFNDDSSVKNIYNYVGLPFEMDPQDGYYTFNSDEMSAYFANGPQSGTKVDNVVTTHDLTYRDTPQPMPSDANVASGSNGWFPYNSQESYSVSQTDYHFGMRADIPFSMTTNGRVKETDDESRAIEYYFSGDDDVWIFIDDKLVVDLGGIHNRLNVRVDFAANTVTYSSADSNETGSINDSTFTMVQKLFDDSEGTGLLGETREHFATRSSEHTLQMFYLERGEGSSNAEIRFNLPMHDAVIITKDATKSWSQAAADADLAAGQTEDPGVEDLTSSEQASVNNLLFGFTLYKKTADQETFVTVPGTNYYLLDTTGNVRGIQPTDENGRFYLRNGYSAKFITEIPAEGITYYVVEDKVPTGFIAPDFNFAGTAANGYTFTGISATEENSSTGTTVNGAEADAGNIPEQIIPEEATENKSYEITVKGSMEAIDTIEFICSNYLDAALPNPAAIANEDVIVVDFGLPVVIDPLANDLFRGEDIEIVAWGNDSLTLTEKEDDNLINQGSWTGEQTLHSGELKFHDVDYAVNPKTGIVSRDTMTYELTKPLTQVEVITYIIRSTGKEKHPSSGVERTQNDYDLGKIYIVPATSMYYEENFGSLVTFQQGYGTWTAPEKAPIFDADGNLIGRRQEPGVVGTENDSSYGCDGSYQSDRADSYGTSYEGDTTNGPIRFFYSFTGTGTSIYARTAQDTGYIQVKLFEGEKTTNAELAGTDYKNIYYRDTYYKADNGNSATTLYNVPVYSESNLPYGTYTVLVTVAKKGTPTLNTDHGEGGAGNKFYLDGIRVYQPLQRVDENGNIVTGKPDANTKYNTITQKALSAYALDGESNAEVITLRQKLISDNEDGISGWDNFVVLTDNGNVTTAEDYVSAGPKEELYLAPGQTVTFALKSWHREGYLLHLGMKAPGGYGKVLVGSDTYELRNTVEHYYDITAKYSVLQNKYEQARNADGCLLYTDGSGSQVYEGTDGYFYYTNGTKVGEAVDLTPVDDTTKPYQVAIFTLSVPEDANGAIVSLTNLKLTGEYEFTLVEERGRTIDIDGYEN